MESIIASLALARSKGRAGGRSEPKYYSISISKGSSARESRSGETILHIFRSSIMLRRLPCSGRLGNLGGRPLPDCSFLIIREVVILSYIFHVDMSYLRCSTISSKFSHATELGRARIGIGDDTFGHQAFSAAIVVLFWPEEWSDGITLLTERVFFMPSVVGRARGSMLTLCVLRLSPEVLLYIVLYYGCCVLASWAECQKTFCFKKQEAWESFKFTFRTSSSK